MNNPAVGMSPSFFKLKDGRYWSLKRINKATYEGWFETSAPAEAFYPLHTQISIDDYVDKRISGDVIVFNVDDSSRKGLITVWFRFGEGVEGATEVDTREFESNTLGDWIKGILIDDEKKKQKQRITAGIYTGIQNAI